MSDTNQERKNAVREAWKNERAHVRDAKGTRDWSQSEQREITAKGRANGYEGHHMKSVKEYPQYAGDPHNIQFLNRSEHVNGAHKGNTQNATNGYYDPKTGTMHSFGSRGPQAPQAQPLSAPLAQKQQNSGTTREQAAGNKGIEAARQKAAANKARSNSDQSTNKGIESYQSKVSGQSAGTTKSSASSTTKGSGASGGKSNGGQER